MVEDPGPYILVSLGPSPFALADAQGVPLECRYMVTIPSEVAIVDIDTK